MLNAFPLESSKFKFFEHNLFNHTKMANHHPDVIDLFDATKDETSLWIATLDYIKLCSQLLFEEEAVKQLYAKKDEFDLFIIDGVYNEVRFPSANASFLNTFF